MANISLAIKALKIGHYVHLPIGWVSHPFVLNSFLVKDEKQLNILKNLGLEKIIVDIERSQIQDFDELSANAIDELSAIENKKQIDAEEVARQQAEIARLKVQTAKQQDQWWLILRQARKNYRIFYV